MRSTIQVENRRDDDGNLDPWVYVTCPACGECEGQPVDQQRHHLEAFTFVDHGDAAADDDITEMECNTCDFVFSLSWNYDNVVEEVSDLEFIQELTELIIGDAPADNWSRLEILAHLESELEELDMLRVAELNNANLEGGAS